MKIDTFLKKWHFQKFYKANTVIRRFLIRLNSQYIETTDTVFGGPDDNRLQFIEYQAECEIYNTKCGIVKAYAPANFYKSSISVDQETRICDVLEYLDAELSKQLHYAYELSQGNPSFERPIMVVLVGAGFSKGFGFPITSGLKDDSLTKCSNPSFSDHHFFEESLSEYPISEFKKGKGGIPDIEYLLTVWNGYQEQVRIADQDEYAKELWRYGAFIRNLVCHLYRYGNEIFANTEYTARFEDLKKWLKIASQKYDIRFLTFNYDLILENLIKSSGLKYCYLGRSNEFMIPIRKLHGSINWYNYGSKLKDYELLYNGQNQFVHCSPDLKSLSFTDPLNPPVIVPPQAQKEYQGLQRYIWSFGLGDIINASKVLIVGYSFPMLDAYARITLRSELNNRDKTMWYINPNQSDCSRVANILNLKTKDIIEENWSIDHFYKFLSC